MVDRDGLQDLALWFKVKVAIGSALILGFVVAMAMVNKWDLGGYKKAAHEEGYGEGFEKGKAYGHDLGQGEPKFADGGVEYAATYCEPTFLHKQVCLVRHLGTMGSVQFIQVPVDEPAIKPGQKFRVSYSSGGYVYFTE